MKAVMKRRDRSHLWHISIARAHTHTYTCSLSLSDVCGACDADHHSTSPPLADFCSQGARTLGKVHSCWHSCNVRVGRGQFVPVAMHPQRDKQQRRGMPRCCADTCMRQTRSLLWPLPKVALVPCLWAHSSAWHVP